MYIKRTAEIHLNRWKLSKYRKPLIIRGARQVGKSTLVEHFSAQYSHFIQLNLDRIEDRIFFNQFVNVQDLVNALFIKNNITDVRFQECLLFIDEIQESPEAISMLRYFYEDLPDLHVIAAGSLLGITLSAQVGFPET